MAKARVHILIDVCLRLRRPETRREEKTSISSTQHLESFGFKSGFIPGMFVVVPMLIIFVSCSGPCKFLWICLENNNKKQKMI